MIHSVWRRSNGLPLARQMSSEDLAAAAAELARRDPALGRVIEATGPPDLRPPHESPFAALVRAITFQQLAGRAASAIHGRFLAAMPDGLTPEAWYCWRAAETVVPD